MRKNPKYKLKFLGKTTKRKLWEKVQEINGVVILKRRGWSGYMMISKDEFFERFEVAE